MENLTTWQPVQPEMLMQLGKTAAQTSATSGMSLTDAVVRTIGMQKLNAEQVRRVVEHANHSAFHQKYASMDASMRIVDLEGGPADPAAVIERLNLAAAPTKVANATSDYSMGPVQKTASFTGLGLHTAAPMSKTAALVDVYALQSQLKYAHEELTADTGALKHRVQDAVRELAGLVKQALHEGAYFEDFAQAWSPVSRKYAAEILGQLDLPRAPAHVKTASRKIASGHPLMTCFRKYAKYASEYETTQEAVRSVEAELVNIDEYLRRPR
jgi:hypothetical protein